jgi:hypothetical protein
VDDRKILVAPCYGIVTAGENWVSVVASGVVRVVPSAADHTWPDCRGRNPANPNFAQRNANELIRTMLATTGMLLAALGVVCVMLEATGPAAAFAAAAYSMCYVSSTADRCG